jgi:hypothetical protein
MDFPCLCMELVGEFENITIACSLLVVSVLLAELLIVCKVLGSFIVCLLVTIIINPDLKSQG